MSHAKYIVINTLYKLGYSTIANIQIQQCTRHDIVHTTHLLLCSAVGCNLSGSHGQGLLQERGGGLEASHSNGRIVGQQRWGTLGVERGGRREEESGKEGGGEVEDITIGE